MFGWKFLLKVLLFVIGHLSIDRVDSFVTIPSRYLLIHDLQSSMVTSSSASDILRPKDSLQSFPNNINSILSTTTQPIQLLPIPNLTTPPLHTLPALVDTLLPTLFPSRLLPSQPILPPTTTIILSPPSPAGKKEETWGKLGTLRVEATSYLFLQKELKIGEHHLINIMAKHPSILYLRVESNLRPTVEGINPPPPSLSLFLSIQLFHTPSLLSSSLPSLLIAHIYFFSHWLHTNLHTNSIQIIWVS